MCSTRLQRPLDIAIAPYPNIFQQSKRNHFQQEFNAPQVVAEHWTAEGQFVFANQENGQPS